MASLLTTSVTGDITATGNVTAYSDEKLKENIVVIDSALEKTLKLRGVYYTKKDDEEHVRKIGVIAQEVKEVLPEVILEDEEGLFSVDYGNIVAVLIEAIKELKAEVESLKSN